MKIMNMETLYDGEICEYSIIMMMDHPGHNIIQSSIVKHCPESHRLFFVQI